MTAHPPFAVYATAPHDCPYLPNRTACTAFVDPSTPLTPVLYDEVLALGLRRSGGYVYRPICAECSACRSLRIPVAEFSPRRRHRRVRQRNGDLRVTISPPQLDTRHYHLFQRYVAARHAGGGMDDSSPEFYRRFMFAGWSETEMLELHHGDELLAVAITDHTPQSLSAVYTFFEPMLVRRSLGTLAILLQIERARTMSKRWLYLGYWIAECPSMRYKTEFTPHEIFGPDGQWRRETPHGDSMQE